ncbi:hypothetical protein KEJ39_04175 [Candidatus Bathyarchaeota archaeon]|nr:hypothetical protein [Candidatus Bathyarchaeota archaeon]
MINILGFVKSVLSMLFALGVAGLAVVAAVMVLVLFGVKISVSAAFVFDLFELTERLKRRVVK